MKIPSPSTSILLLSACFVGACSSPKHVELESVLVPRSEKSGGGLVERTMSSAKGVSLDPVAADLEVRESLEDTDFLDDDGRFSDFHIFEGSRGELIEVTLRSTEFDAFVFVLRRNANDEWIPIAIDDDGGDNLDSRVSVELAEDGTYVVAATSALPGGLGRYTLRIDSLGKFDFPTVAADAQRLAVLVGPSDYPVGTVADGTDLPAVDTDLELMHATLVSKFGFRPEEIVVLRDARATRLNIVRAFREHLARLRPDCTAIFYYSGHGMRLSENQGVADDETDGLDEALYLADSGILLDDEIDVLRNELKARNVLVVIDACHSGTAMMGESGVRMKEVREDVVAPLLRTTGDPIRPDVGAAREASAMMESNQVVLTSSRDLETSLCAASGSHLPEGRVEAPVSVFTYCFVLALELEGEGATFTDVHRTTYALMSPWLNANGLDQQPQVFGKRAGEAVRKFLAVGGGA